MAEEVWCKLTQFEARSLIASVGLERDLGPDDLPTLKNPNQLCKSLTKMMKAKCMRGWTVTKYLSSGASGHVFSGRDWRGNNVAIKVQIGDARRIKREVKMHRKFLKLGLAPKIFRHCSFKPENPPTESQHQIINNALGTAFGYPNNREVHVTIMEEVSGVLKNWLRVPRTNEQLKKIAFDIVALTKAMKAKKVTHGDFHTGNIGYVYTDSAKRKMKLTLIDFDRSSPYEANPRLESGALWYSLWPQRFTPASLPNRVPLTNYLRQYFLSEVQVYVGQNREAINIVFRDHLREYMGRLLRREFPRARRN